MKQPAVYIVTNRKNGVLYIGVTSDLVRRIYQHKSHAVEGFTEHYCLERLVWYELHGTMESAIRREHNLKHWRREWKTALIEENNPDWRDLWPDIVGWR
ncbi:MAG: GIY-YIG nuclease family protein [Neisseria sp.]|nr:GIY-YIG nuclease family protein [Neisseria sp.]